MAKLGNHLEIYKVLPKTNCRQCGLNACLAFAVAVMQGQKRLADCPHLPPDNDWQVGNGQAGRDDAAEEAGNVLLGLQERVRQADLGEMARRLGLDLRQGRLVIPVLGKDFELGPDGLISTCHVNSWVSLPILSYALDSAGLEPGGAWLPFRELPGALDWTRFFEHRCEKALKRVIDEYTDLFELIVDIFDGRPAPRQFDSDIAVLIHPLPKLPMLLCYWRPDEGMESSLSMFFDASAPRNLGLEAIYILATGLVVMFEKIALTHGR